MPASLLAAAAGPLAAGIDAFATGNMNKKSRAFATQMYERQKYDNLNFWNMQNEYNSPAAQMQRFTDAGLNPALIYGQQNTAGPLTSPDVQKPEFNAPQPGQAALSGTLSAIDAITNLEMKQAQTDNLKVQRDVIVQDALLKAGQIGDIDMSRRRKMFDLDLAGELRQTSVDAAKEQLRQTKVNTDINIRRDIREAVQQSANLSEISERIQNMVAQRQSMRLQNANTVAEKERIIQDTRRIRQQISLMAKEGVIKQFDVDLARQNIRPSDPWYVRGMSQAIQSVWNFLFE